MTFEADGFSVTLTDRFKTSDLKGFVLYCKRSDMSFFALRESFDAFAEGAELDAAGYAAQVMAANELKGQVSERDGLVYFTYEKKVAAKRFSYYAFAFEGSEDFWLIQFAIPAKKQAKLEEELWAFAATVTVP